MKKQVILYTTQKCAKCKSLKNWLRRNKVPFTEKDLGNTDIMVDLVMRNLTVLAAPAIEFDSRFFLSNQIFDANNRLTSAFKEFLKDKKSICNLPLKEIP